MSRDSGAHEGGMTPSIGGHDTIASPLLSVAPNSPARIQTDLYANEKVDHLDDQHHNSSMIPLVTPHPPVLRDDRPVSHIHYGNPAEVTPLEHSLWLPRDPLKPVDLGDTISYNGRALVSSEGGDGIIGSFEAFGCIEDEMDEMEQHEKEEAEADTKRPESPNDNRSTNINLSNSLAPPSPHPPHSPALSRRTSRAASHHSFDYGMTLKGNERIRVAADVAAKVALEGGKPAVASSSNGSDAGSIVSGGMRRRRSTQTSLASGRMPSPQHSPVLRRSPVGPPRPGPPGIPNFVQEPEAVGGGSDMLSPQSAITDESGAFPFPPGSPNSTTSPTRKPRRLTISSLSPPSSRIGIGSPPVGSVSSNRRRSTRTARSNSLAPSIQHSITLSRIDEPGAGDQGEDEQEIISQAAALRAELLHEELQAHQKHLKKEQARQDQESKDRQGKSGFLRKLLVRTEDTEEADDT